MTKKSNEEEFYGRWMSSIKSDDIHSILLEVQKTDLDAKRSLECLVAISHITYENGNKRKLLKSCPEDILQLTQRLCCLYCSKPPKNTLKYLTCLFHIANYFLKENHFLHVATLFKEVVKFKQSHVRSYEDDAKTLHNPFTSILKESVMKTVSKKVTPENRSLISTLFSLLLEINVKSSNGKVLLETILQAVSVVIKRDHKEIIRLINTGLNVFSKSDDIRDINSSLAALFNICTFLFHSQNIISGQLSALAAVESQLEYVKSKHEENLSKNECFMLVLNSLSILIGSDSQIVMLKNIQENTKILRTFQNTQEDENKRATYKFVLFLLHSHGKRGLRVSNETCLEPFIDMILNFCTNLKNSPTHKFDILHILSNTLCLLIDADPTSDKELLQICVPQVLKVEQCIEITFNELRSAEFPKGEKNTFYILSRLANLIRNYHIAGLMEEVITIAKPICNFIITLSAEYFEDPQNRKALDLCFTCLASALGTKQIEKVLEILVVWLVKTPQSSPKVFKIWADYKHNLVCEHREDGLETNVLTIVNKMKSDSEWPPFKLSSVEKGNLLVQELKAYIINKTLRGKPVISAANALLSLDIDCLTKVKGLIIVMNTVTSNPDFNELCDMYENQSKSLITSLRKEKKKFDPVEFNFCMGDLLYSQFRCKLKNLRTKCECEVVKQTLTKTAPLVAELPESQPDPNDTCDVATRYQNLSLALQRKLMEAMDSAIRYWGFACDMLKELPQAKFDLDVTLFNLKEAGTLLKLYCDEEKEVKVWNLLYNIALVVGDVNMIVLAAGELMSTNTNVEPEVMEKVMACINNNQDLTKETKWHHTLKSALRALKDNKIEDGLVLLKTFEESEEKSGTLMSQLYSLIGQFQKLSDWKKFNIAFNSSPSFHLSLHMSLRRLLAHVKDVQWGCFGELCLQQHELMSVTYLLGESNWALEQPREARSYLKTTLPIAHQLALPLRTVQLLLLLGWIDLNTGVVEDCALKLEGIEDLLEICGTPVVYGRSADSPYLDKTVIQPPDYLSHPHACQCLPCRTVEYRRLVLETVTLRASFCAAFGAPRDATQSFEVAKLVERDLSKSNVREVCKSCASMWLHYANFKAASQDYQEALTANGKACELLTFVGDHIGLQKTFEQKTLIQVYLHHLPFTAIRPKLVIEAKNQISSKIITPKSGKITVSENSPLATINKNIKPATPFRRPVRPLRMPSSGEENSPVTATKQKRKTKLPPKFVNETPKNICKLSNSSTKSFVIVDDDGKAVGFSGTKSVPCSRRKVKDVGSLQQSKNTSKKKLFCSGSTDSKSNHGSTSGDQDEVLIVRQSRRIGVKTYGKASKCESSLKRYDQSKLDWSGDVYNFDQIKNSMNGICSTNSTPQASNSESSKRKTVDRSKVGQSNVFSFDQMKHSINEIGNPDCRSLTDVIPEKLDSSLSLKKQGSSSFGTQLSREKDDSSRTRDIKSIKYSIDSNCDCIDGTPPESPKKSVSLIPKRVTRSRKL